MKNRLERGSKPYIDGCGCFMPAFGFEISLGKEKDDWQAWFMVQSLALIYVDIMCDSPDG